MAGKDLSETILIIKAKDRDAAAALRSKRNAARHCIHSVYFDEITSGATTSREATPLVPRREFQLHLKLSPAPRDPARGFIFGSNEDACDIHLQESADADKFGISSEHFRIDFNWEDGATRLNNMSRKGTGYMSPSQKDHQHLTGPTMTALHVEEETTITVGRLYFYISFPQRNSRDHQQYFARYEAYRAKYVDDIPGISSMGINTRSGNTAMQLRRQGNNSKHMFLLSDEIGRGGYGSVCRAKDCETNRTYAAKKFLGETSRHVSRARLEIAISNRISHQNIVKFVDYVNDDGGLILIMEYMPRGNLLEAHHDEELRVEEVGRALRQASKALVYLHEEENIAHRDIKPENILIKYRSPLSIKLCDFGLSTEKTLLTTKEIGTRVYMAPEIWKPPYDRAVDIWSLGVVGMQFTIRLPPLEGAWDIESWCGRVNQRIQSKPGPLNALLRPMLDLSPQKRPTARKCYNSPDLLLATSSIEMSDEEIPRLPYSEMEKSHWQDKSPQLAQMNQGRTEIKQPELYAKGPSPKAGTSRLVAVKI